MFKLGSLYYPKSHTKLNQSHHLSENARPPHKRFFVTPPPRPNASLTKKTIIQLGSQNTGMLWLVAGGVCAIAAWMLSRPEERSVDARSKEYGADAKLMQPAIFQLHKATLKSQAGGLFPATHPDKNLHSIAGYEDILDSLADLVVFLQNPNDYVKDGAKAPKGVILSGPPGTGKTTLAEAVAGHAGVPLILVPSGELQSNTVGGTEEKLRKIFDDAKRIAPCVICFDEFESIGGKRIKDGGNNAVHARYINSEVNQLLTLLSSAPAGIVIIGTTNNFDQLDAAVVRPGRFDQHIALSLPSQKERLKIFKIYTANKHIGSDVSFEDLSALTAGYAGAKIEVLVDQAALAAKKHSSSVITSSHFDAALEALELGHGARRHENLEVKRRTAAHEAGHALVGHLLGQRIYKVSVLKSGQTLGKTITIPPEDENLTQAQLENLICQALAGRAAEILHGAPSTGCADDFEIAKTFAQHMIHKEGMGRSILGSNLEVEALLQRELNRAIALLKENRPTWERISAALVARDQLQRGEFVTLVEGRELEINKHWLWRTEVTPKAVDRKLLPPAAKPRSQNANQPKVISGKTTGGPLDIVKVGRALKIDPSKISQIEVNDDFFYYCKIIFKPNFKDHEYVEQTVKSLKRNDIECTYFTHNRELTIYADGKEGFLHFIKDNG